MAEINDSLLPLSLTQTEINAITTPNTGDIVFNTTINLLQFWNGIGWIDATGSIVDYANIIGVTQVTATIPTLTMSGSVDNFDPGIHNLWRLDPNGSDRDFTGILAPAAGVSRFIVFINISTNKKVKWKNNTTSTAPNRMLLRDNSNKDQKKGDGVIYFYDHISQRWRPYGLGAH